MKVRFTETRIVDDYRKGTSDEERYEAGREYDLPEASANRWINRKAAALVRDGDTVTLPHPPAATDEDPAAAGAGDEAVTDAAGDATGTTAIDTVDQAAAGAGDQAPQVRKRNR